MSVRFLNPHNVSHGEESISKCRQASVRSRFTEVRTLFGDASPFPERSAGFQPVCEIDVVTEDVVKALSIAPGTTAALSFDVADAEGGDDKTVTGANAVYMGPVEDVGRDKSGPATATMHFVCYSSDGSTNPISIA
ncbi:MAG TPA: hypothetical protein VMZ92_15005 [Planctomycetota bacterium]|nr:hypothetical protein [Planctomycetota bacterium]